MARTLRSKTSLAGALALACGLVALGGCGGGDSADAEKGKQLFTQRCGSCHVLAEAGTKGTIGPDLDAAFQQSLADGLGRSTIEGVVRGQIDLPQGGEMPADLVVGDDAEAVSAYVADVVGKSGQASSEPAPDGDGGGGTARANARNQLEIPADPTGQLRYEDERAVAKPGELTLLSPNESPVPHDISIKGGGIDEQGNQVENGGVSRVSVNVKKGEYTFYCSVPGHEEAGMKGPLEVR